jgi:hypothetical protein
MDDDVASVSLSTTTVTTTEAGGTDSFTIVLDSEPTQDVTITFSSIDASEIQLDVSSLTFSDYNWNVTQSVNVRGENDFIDDGDITFVVVTTATSSDPLYSHIAVANVTATNTDGTYICFHCAKPVLPICSFIHILSKLLFIGMFIRLVSFCCCHR